MYSFFFSFEIKIFINRRKETSLHFENYIEDWYSTKTLIVKNIDTLINDCFSRVIVSQRVASHLMHFVNGSYTNGGIEEIYRQIFLRKKYRGRAILSLVLLSSDLRIRTAPPLPLAFVIGKVWEIERLQIARARVLQWRASSESHVRSSELHRRPRYTRIHLRGATFIFCYRELYLDGGRVARLKNSR